MLQRDARFRPRPDRGPLQTNQHDKQRTKPAAQHRSTHAATPRRVNDRPWVTTAETCECAIAHLGVGDYDTAIRLFTAAQKLREPDGRYITGMVHSELTMFPPGERSTYSAAAVLLTAEAIEGSSPAAKLFSDHRFLPPIIDIDPVDSGVTNPT